MNLFPNQNRFLSHVSHLSGVVILLETNGFSFLQLFFIFIFFCYNVGSINKKCMILFVTFCFVSYFIPSIMHNKYMYLVTLSQIVLTSTNLTQYLQKSTFHKKLWWILFFKQCLQLAIFFNFINTLVVITQTVLFIKIWTIFMSIFFNKHSFEIRSLKYQIPF